MVMALQVLKTAKRFLQTHRWEQGKLITDKNGDEVGSYSRAAGACALGALCIADHRLDSGRAYLEAKDLLQVAMDGDIVYFNNAPRRQKKTILARFDRAIKAAH